MWESVDRLIGLCAGTVSFSKFIRQALLEAYMTATLANHDPSVALQRVDQPVE